MLQSHYKYILLGAGLASGSAAGAIRERDPAGSILLVGQEVNRPYHRPLLHRSYLKREIGRAAMVIESPQWFSDRRIELSTGRQATQLDPIRQSVTLNSGEEISFDRLLIATGASARQLTIPGAGLPNVFTLRTIEDADRLHHAIEQAKSQGRGHDRGLGGSGQDASGRHDPVQPHPGRGVAAIVGGGLLGVELAATLTELGLAVELIVAADFPFKKFAGEYTGKVVANHLIERGVRLHVGQRPVRIEGDGRAQRVVLGNGSVIACDFVVEAIGAQPNKEILRGTSINAEKAILVDQHGQTNVPNIFAAGDCAAIFDPLFGKHRILDHWDNARITGEIAGTNMAGGSVSYQTVNRFDTHAFDLQLTGFGEARLVDRRHIRATANAEARAFIEIGLAVDGRIAQILAVGKTDNVPLLEALVRERANVLGKEAMLNDPSASFEELLK